jgi:hypothetical protein
MVAHDTIPELIIAVSYYMTVMYPVPCFEKSLVQGNIS